MGDFLRVLSQVNSAKEVTQRCGLNFLLHMCSLRIVGVQLSRRTLKFTTCPQLIKHIHVVKVVFFC